MSLETQLIALAQAIGADIKDLRGKQGDLTALTTTAKNSLVAAINEIKLAHASAGVTINDLAGNGDTGVVWSADKVYDTIEAAKVALRNELTNGASAALDTLRSFKTPLATTQLLPQPWPRRCPTACASMRFSR